MTRTSLLVVVFSGLLACALADNLRAMDQVLGPAAGFLRSGQVADRETRTPLSGAIVELPELGIRVVSDELGRVDLGRLPTGRHRLTAERVGYGRINLGELPVPWNEDFLILLDRDPTYDPQAPGRIAGRVTEESRKNRRVSNVEVTVLSPARAGTLTDGRGRFNLTDLEPGLVQVQFTHLSYAPRMTTLIVHPGRTVEINASMSAQPIELEAIEVTVRSAYLERNGFYRRLERGFGKQFTQKDLEAIDPMYVSDVIWRVPGVMVRRRNDGRTVAVSGRGLSFSGGGCVLPVYVDGFRVYDVNLDQYPPEWIDAMEVYHGIAGTAVKCGMLNSCGVVPSLDSMRPLNRPNLDWLKSRDPHSNPRIWTLPGKPQVRKDSWVRAERSTSVSAKRATRSPRDDRGSPKATAGQSHPLRFITGQRLTGLG